MQNRIPSLASKDDYWLRKMRFKKHSHNVLTKLIIGKSHGLRVHAQQSHQHSIVKFNLFYF